MLASGDSAFKAPYGVPAGSPRFALWAQRHAYEYGTTDEHRAAVVLTCREHAQLNPRAIWYGTPLTLDEYLGADLISSPLRILDCDMPVDGAVALIFSSADRAPDLRAKPIYVESLGHATGPSIDPDRWPDATTMASKYAGQEMWARTDLEPKTSTSPRFMTGSQFLPLAGWRVSVSLRKARPATGSSKATASSVVRCLSALTVASWVAGRLHGFGKVAETVLQLRGEAGQRQVQGAEVGITCAGGGPSATSMILTT